MKNGTPLLAVIFNSYSENGTTDFIQCIGITNSIEIAYGMAFMRLSDLKEDCPELQMTAIYRLEGDTGYGISLHDKNERQRYSAEVLIDGEWQGIENESSK